MINIEALQEDLRKVAIALMIAGFADIFFNQQSYLYSSYIIISGGVIWFLGLVKKRE